MTYFASTGQSSINLQATLAAGSAMSEPLGGAPHHPVTCLSKLYYHEDGAFECEHGRVPAGDPRTQMALDYSMAILLMELMMAEEETP